MAEPPRASARERRDDTGGGSSSHAGGRRRRPPAGGRAQASGDLSAPPSRLALFAHRRGVSVTTVGAIVGIVIFLMLTLAVPVRTYIAQRKEFSQLQQSNAELIQQTREYRSRLAQQSDPAYIENEARARLQYVMPGDKAVVIVDPAGQARQAEQAAERQRAATPWYENLMDAVSTPPKG